MTQKENVCQIGFETNREEDNDAREKLTIARISMLLQQPWFGSMATRLILQNADSWCPTLATDGRHFFYNSKFVGLLSNEQAMFGFGHEFLHNVYAHIDRTKDNNFHPQLSHDH